MARTRRKHSYRKSRRWNPEIAPGFKAALAQTPIKSTGYSSMAAMPNPRGHRGHRRKGRSPKRAWRTVYSREINPRKRARQSGMHRTRGGEMRYQKRPGWGFKGHASRAAWGWKGKNKRGGMHRNPRGRSSRASRARSWHRKVRDSVPYWSKGKNPRKGRYYNGRKSTRRHNPRGHRGHRRKSRKWTCKGFMGRKRRNPRSGKYRYAKRALKKLSRSRRRHVVDYALGSFNPRRRAKRGRR
jgi:hypothetical protein